MALAGWTTVFSLFGQPDAPDVRLHPHNSDAGCGFGTQPVCETVLPKHGGIGTTLRLWMHKNRCMAAPQDIKLIEVGAPVFVFAGTDFIDAPAFDPQSGWGWIDPASVFLVLTTTGNPDGRAFVDLEVPNDPALVGHVVYFQAVVIESDEVRESTGGRLEVQP